MEGGTAGHPQGARQAGRVRMLCGWSRPVVLLGSLLLCVESALSFRNPLYEKKSLYPWKNFLLLLLCCCTPDDVVFLMGFFPALFSVSGAL